MAWVRASTGEDYDGPVHELFGKVYSGETHTTASVRLIEVPKSTPSSKPAKGTKRVSKRTKPE